MPKGVMRSTRVPTCVWPVPYLHGYESLTTQTEHYLAQTLHSLNTMVDKDMMQTQGLKSNKRISVQETTHNAQGKMRDC